VVRGGGETLPRAIGVDWFKSIRTPI